eukprot:CAMPEP_0202701796 /NCGR_PEP_ID=MMETSP1385-20130828/14844_1 /ASSEMBLY_ACC=CAM_ASM_000861 /TAXON_ID=933848 /ORGANISM="Elphidium margaritaceum" /LENGTH=530 /DNA_ID=CAMNT_0049359285 /DNA_START=133 /DNA_END=1722 /DNA_ORIENTATION=-
MTVEPAMQLSSQISFLAMEIKHIDAQLVIDNAKLTELHDKLKIEHSLLLHQINLKEMDDACCLSQPEIDVMCAEYQQLADEYNGKNSSFHDRASDLVVLQQKMHKLLLGPALQATLNSKLVHHTNRVCLGNLVVDSSNADGGRPVYSPSSQASALPPIMEGDAEYDEEHEHKQHAPQDWTQALSTASTSESQQTDQSAQHSELSSISPVSISFGTHKHRTEKENMEPDSDLNPFCTPPSQKHFVVPVTQQALQCHTEQQQQHDEEEEEGQKHQQMVAPMASSSPRPHTPRLTSLEYRIDDLLQHMLCSEVHELCAHFNRFILVHCVTLKAMQLLLRKIILHSIDNQPEIFGTKYCVLLQSIVAQFQRMQLQSMDNTVVVVDTHELIALQSTDLAQLIWRLCFDVFHQLHMCDEADSFRNVMIVIAELLNAKLITSADVLDCVFQSILCDDNRAYLCENDIEGLYEIMKRCYRTLVVTKSNESCLRRYFSILEQVKHWPKFSHGMQRVPFMVNQMKALANLDNKHKLKRAW